MTKVTIFGYHPDVFPGFPALMTINLAYGFWKCGCNVNVLMPETESHSQTTVIEKKGINVEKLNRYGADFDIKILNKKDK